MQELYGFFNLDVQVFQNRSLKGIVKYFVSGVEI
jgi:hypothetical protein